MVWVHHRRHRRGDVELDFEGQCLDHLGDDPVDLDLFGLRGEAPTQQRGHHQHVLDQAQLTAGLPIDDGDETSSLTILEALPVPQQRLTEPQDRGQRCTQLVGHGGHEACLVLVGVLQVPDRLTQPLDGSADYQRGHDRRAPGEAPDRHCGVVAAGQQRRQVERSRDEHDGDRLGTQRDRGETGGVDVEHPGDAGSTLSGPQRGPGRRPTTRAA